MQKRWTEVYVGLGGNIGDSLCILKKALDRLACLPSVKDLKASPFYLTSPVGKIPQNFFTNAVCSFKTCLTPRLLLEKLQKIEIDLGKWPKPKEAPRPIDLDILFFGVEKYHDEALEIPHPHWQNRLFVLIPLSNLTNEIDIPYSDGIKKVILSEFLQSFTNPNKETVSLVFNEGSIDKLGGGYALS
jgi:2-amino-4-hydroxy-6-hydroxymethyldihydropteridine diphosphokinase